MPRAAAGSKAQPRAASAKKAEPKPKKNAMYRLAAPIPLGTIVTDLGKKSWKIGKSIGTGGFGAIYSASEVTQTNQKDNSDAYVIKVEPHENGPLFVELNFYRRVGKLSDIEEWMQKKKISSLGMPHFCGFGSFEYKSERYRFLVMKRFQEDLWSLFLKNGKKFPASTVFQLGLQTLDVLEYIHDKSYVHADIKGSNMLLDSKGSCVYLVDFGLVSRYGKSYKPDPKKAHNGTIEYTSRDAHLGITSRRGDLEILGYNMVQWLTSRLPWEGLTDPVKVHQEKNVFMKDVSKSLKKCFGNESPPEALVKYFTYVSQLSPEDDLDYELCKKILKAGISSSGRSGGKLVFSVSSQKTPQKRLSQDRGKSPAAKKSKEAVSSNRKKAGKQNGSVQSGRELYKAPINSVQEYRVNGLIDMSSDVDTEESLVLEKSDDDIFSPSRPVKSTRDKKKRRLSVVAKKVITPVPQKKRAPRTKKSGTQQPGMSWRDCPTILASNFSHAATDKESSDPPEKTVKKTRQKKK